MSGPDNPLHAARAAAGRAGARARWAGRPAAPTRTVRAYAPDADTLAARATDRSVTVPDIIRDLLLTSVADCGKLAPSRSDDSVRDGRALTGP